MRFFFVVLFISVFSYANAQQYELRITVTGLEGDGVSFDNHHSPDTLTISSNGTEVFALLNDGDSYDLNITNQPMNPNQICNFTSSDGGSINGSHATVTVDCETINYALRANVSGLLGNRILVENVGYTTFDISLNSNGLKTINLQPDGSNYAVNITSQPSQPNQLCDFSGGDGTGTLSGGVEIVDIFCVTVKYNININVTGLAATNTVSFSNGADTLDVSANGTQTISIQDDGTGFDVNITTQPDTPNQTCSFIGSDSGTLVGTDVTVNVECATNQYFIGGTLSGLLRGNYVILQNNLTDDKSLFSNGAFVFNTPLDDESLYSVTVKQDPLFPIQSCEVQLGSGTLSGDDVTNVELICEYLLSNDLIYRHGFEDEPPNL